MKRQLLFCSLLLAAAASHAGVTATFDDLAAPPSLNGSTTIQWTNPGNSLEYKGVLWDDRFGIVGVQYKVDVLNGPLFGLPHSGHYFVTNHTGASGMKLTTSKVLTGAWFGRNEYYGYGAGADQVTIVALNGATELASIVFDLPELHAGQPEPLSFVDTSMFASVGAITGYRIDRRELGQQSGNWVADDFQFADATQVPAPGSLWLAFGGLAALAVALRRRRQQ